MPVLITGGTGYIGAGLARSLVEKGEDAVLFDIAPRTECIADIKDKVKLIQGDLTVWPEVLNVVKENNIQGIFHLGGMLSGPSDANPWASFQTNVVGTMHTLEAARLFGVKRVFFASTAITFGSATSHVITDETLQRPSTMYGAGKLYGELLGRFYQRKFGLDFRCLRFFGVIGPGAKLTPHAAYKSVMIENAALGKAYECPVAEDTVTFLTYFKDAVRAIEMLYNAPRGEIKTTCYNVVGMSRPTTAKALAQTVKQHIPAASIRFKPDPALNEFAKGVYQSIDVFDDSRAREEWGWEPLYGNLEEMVADFIQEVRTRPQLYGLA